MSNDPYTQDGVNVAEGDSFSEAAGNICRASFRNAPSVHVRDFSRGHFRGPRGFRMADWSVGLYADLAPDGIGTKTVVIDAAHTHPQAGRDLMAMCNGDITRWGGMPLVLTNVLEVATLGSHKADASTQDRMINAQHRTLIEGLAEAAKEQNVVLYKGETAETGVCVGSEIPDSRTRFNWSGVVFGIYDDWRVITGSTLAAKQSIIALREYGFRSNGISSVRKALAIRYGAEWYGNPMAADDILAAATPSVLYDRFLTEANGWYANPRIPMHLIVHVSGGAIKSKFGEDILFPLGLSAEFDNLWEPPQIMKDCAEWRGMNDEQCYQTWNGGQGALVVVDPESEDEFIELARKFGIEARKCGHTLESIDRPRIWIESKFGGEPVKFEKP